MNLPDISSLAIRDDARPGARATPVPSVPADVAQSTDRSMQKLATYARSIPYPIEENAKLQEILDFILVRITQCVEAKDYDPGLMQWDSMLS